MNDHELTHERCSELLAGFAGGRLDAEQTVRVESHLSGCADCAAELRAIMALRAGDEPLTDIERGTLRRNVGWSLGDVLPAPRQPSRARTRLAAALGAAAVLAVGGVALVSLSTGGGDEADMGAAVTDAGGNEAERGADTGTASGGAGAAADDATAPRPRPSFDEDAGKLSSRKLRNLGERGPSLQAFSSYSAKDAAALKDAYVNELADQAGTPIGDLILNCAEKVYQAQPYFALPAFGAQGTLEGREALVLGFAWTDEDSGPLDQFMLWTWPRSSCDQPIDYRAGEIAPRK